MSLAKDNSTDRLSVPEYLAREQEGDIRHEYVEGRIFAMTGASVNHNRIAGNLFRHVANHLSHKPCEPFMNDMKVKMNNRYRYPDVMVACNGQFEDDGHSLRNPVLIVEVSSKATRHLDRSEKLMEYINIPSLQEYVLIEQDFASIDVLRRRAGWIPNNYILGDDIAFESIDLTLSVEDIYARVDIEDVVQWLQQKSTAKT